MKKHLSKKALWLSFLSVVTLGIFILLAVGSSVVHTAIKNGTDR